jgi:LysM repeat protein
MKLKLIYCLVSVFVFSEIGAQTITIEEYINTYKEIAISEMIRTGVPASITLAQGIVETENGNSKLVKKSNNHFGIKCKETWTGPSVSHDDDAPGECFRKYNNAEESYIDHSEFLRTRKHYASLFTLDPADYKAWAYGLKKAGYATNPRYPEMLIKYIETYNLNEYSLIALGRKKKDEPAIVKTELPVTEKTKLPEPEKKQPPVTDKIETVLPPTATVAVIETKETAAPAVVQKSTNEKPADVKEVTETKQTVETKPAVSYPAGEFKINEARVVYVLKGTAYLAIAQQYNIPLKYIYDFNDVTEKEILEQDQLIFLQRKRRVGAAEFHIVQEGEKLHDISQKLGIRLEALQQYNLLKTGEQPAAGERLNLQAPAIAAPKLSGASSMNDQETSVVENSQPQIIVHVVQPKETLYSISKKYQVAAEELQKWNRLTSIDLKEGMELIINR